MAKTTRAQRKRAFRMRVEGVSFSAIARELGLDRRTIRKWEKGWIDAHGVRQRGWRAQMERARAELNEAELMGALEARRVRIATYARLADRAVRELKRGLPNLVLGSCRDAKILMSETRELLTLIRCELGQDDQAEKR